MRMIEIGSLQKGTIWGDGVAKGIIEQIDDPGVLMHAFSYTPLFVNVHHRSPVLLSNQLSIAAYPQSSTISEPGD